MKVVLNGCFDCLHAGHKHMINFAIRLAGIHGGVIFLINSDFSARELKGPGRPVVPQDDRALIIAGLESVDAVVLFSEATPKALIADLLPDVLVKGGDYSMDEMIGREEVQAVGGEVKVIPFIHGKSTTSLIQKIQDKPK